MSEKRKRDDTGLDQNSKVAQKRPKRGFKVGPDNLPDGAYRRKNQKLKQALIDHARLKKSYAKLKRQVGDFDESQKLPEPAFAAPDASSLEPANTDPHPDRQVLIEQQAEEPEDAPAAEARNRDRQPARRRPQRKSMPFRKEIEQAERRRAEAEERRTARAEAQRERERKLEERERFRKAMAKARSGGPNGQRKLGRESTVLLEKVKRMVGGGS